MGATGDRGRAGAIHRVVVRPAGIELAVRHGERLMAAANRLGWYWPTACVGAAMCARCSVAVAAPWRASFSPMENDERACLEAAAGPDGKTPGARLACQARVVGDAEVVKRLVRRLEPGDFRIDGDEAAGPP